MYTCDGIFANLFATKNMYVLISSLNYIYEETSLRHGKIHTTS